jgi:hypothetical protein
VLKFPTHSLALVAVALALAPGCQALFGDYKVDSSALENRICQVDEYRCNDALLEVCAPNRSHFETFATCRSAAECNLNSDSCRPCEAGVEKQCAGATLFACNTSSQWEKLKDCPSAALCSPSAGDCLDPGCPEPGKHDCKDAALMRCSADQTRWELVANCASAADCDASQADAQIAAKEPVTCKVTCARGSEACPAPDCTTPGSLRCVGEPPSIERCSESFKWTRREVCTNFVLCDAAEGRCNPKQCDLDERRCTGSTLEVCKDDLTGWKPVKTCAPNQLCDPATEPGAECVAAPCTEGETRCNSLFVEKCNGTSWERSKRCAGACDPATKACLSTP